MGYKVPLVAGLTCALLAGGVAFGEAGFAAPNSPDRVSTQVLAGQPRAVASAKTGSVTGVVRGSSSRAVAGYTVEAFTPDGNFVADAVTDAAGRYAISGLPRGQYRVRVSGPRTGAAPWAMAWVGRQPSLLKARLVSVGGPRVKADVVLTPAAMVVGRVSGVPAGSEVHVCGESFLDCRLAVTDAGGGFEVRGLAAGTASVVVRPVGGSDLAFPAQPPRAGVPLRANQTTLLALDAATQSAPRIILQGKEVRQTVTPPPRDQLAPTVLSATLSQERGKRFVTVVATDGQGGSGLAQVQVRSGDRERPPSPYLTEPISAPGAGEVAVRVSDKAGNFSDWVVAR